MLARLGFSLAALRERLWVGPAITTGLSLVGYAGAYWADRFDLPVPDIALATVEQLLSVMANSLLAVATFAVGSMVSAYAFASNNATPRAFMLVIADDASRRALSVFVGAYVFAMLGLIVIQTHAPGETARFVLFALVVAVIARVILTFVGWVDSIARLGRHSDTIERLEEATRAALRTRGRNGRAGTAAPPGPAPPDAMVLRHDPAEAEHLVGHVQYVDLVLLQRWAAEARLHIWLEVGPGALLARGDVLARISAADGTCDAGTAARMLGRALVISRARSFAEDPGFGLHSLGEIAARALSPGVNDPGTAIAVIERLTALFLFWDALEDRDDDPRHPNLYLPPLAPETALREGFGLIEHDGAGYAAVALALQRSYRVLSGTRPPLAEAARERARDALARSETALTHPADIARVRAASLLGADARNA